MKPVPLGRSWLALCLTFGSAIAAGCGAQVGGGLRSGPEEPMAGSLEVGGRLHRVRHSGPYGGLGLTLAAPEDRFTLRNVTVGTGYHFLVAAPLRIELGPELALGEPATGSYPSTGLYFGGSGSLLLRLPVGGGHDNIVGVAPFGWAVDLVGTARGGRWSRAMESRGPGQWEIGGELGLRVTLFSDLIMASHDSWEGPWTEQ